MSHSWPDFFFQCFFSVCFILVSFYCCIFKFTKVFPLISSLCLILSTALLFFTSHTIVFSSLKSLLWLLWNPACFLSPVRLQLSALNLFYNCQLQIPQRKMLAWMRSSFGVLLFLRAYKLLKHCQYWLLSNAFKWLLYVFCPTFILVFSRGLNW